MKSTRKITIPITIMKIAIKCLKKFRIMIQQEDILVGIIMENKFIFSKVLSKMFNFHIDNNRFASGLKEADIKSVCKNNDRFDKTNYRPIGILPLLLKVFEPCLYYQIYGYIDAILSKDQVSASRIHYNN